MNIAVPRYVIVGLGAVFAGYLLVLALSSVDSGSNPPLYFAAMGLFAVASIACLAPLSKRMSFVVALGAVAVSIALPIMVASQLDLGRPLGSDYSTWYVAGVGALMVFISARGHLLLAWLGVAALVVHTILWAGPGALGLLGVFGSVLWVGVSHMLQSSLRKAEKDARAYAVAERETAEWQAAQEAHLFERQFRLEKTGRMALPMLRHIVATGAQLTPGHRQECLFLEAAIRDEIRGRTLLSDAVREQVMIARRRGATVNLLDEGGLDDLAEGDQGRIRAEVARAIGRSKAETIVVRTVPPGSDTAVTVVGLASSGVNLLGHSAGNGNDESDDPDIELWLEIPRTV
ncbi:hypothetical protein FB562_1775 [Homoserinimonas aerilata]|uniref:Signal transduction histidine kinase n=1 Tax=Homoserinimonas aerilata TaxID=1162970 RepID=A0A542YKQ7_9MICO|nr:hypothetical protein [Homoserinimonas aerilata]TQL48677.1 hypothetical protein FB562_1775 [Homoserinimonas aerilata]